MQFDDIVHIDCIPFPMCVVPGVIIANFNRKTDIPIPADGNVVLGAWQRLHSEVLLG